MRLSEFILTNREPIMVEWEAFARSCTIAGIPMDVAALRDHASEMLTVIAADLETPQGTQEQSEKSKGNAPVTTDPSRTAAEEHGADRAESGYTVEQMVSEFRALRASVIRLWTRAQDGLKDEDLEDLTRFNEAIDQSLAESVTQFSQDLDQSKEMFIAILGHDLRTPLGAVITASTFMLETNELKEPHLTLTSRIRSSATRMNRMVGDLLDLTRSRLGGGIPIVRAEVSMEKIVQDVVDEVSAAHPGRTIEVKVEGTERGEWDCPRMTQALTNLIGNALEHGSDTTAVKVEISGTEGEVTISVHNRGITIPAERLGGIFKPMKGIESAASAAAGPVSNLGLGLYIAERIVHAHEGTIDVASSDAAGTTFTVHLPRR